MASSGALMGVGNMQLPPDTLHLMIDRAKQFIALENDFINCNDLQCQDCPFHNPCQDLHIDEQMEPTHCGQVFLAHAIRAVIDEREFGD